MMQMKAGIAVLVSIVFCTTATAAEPTQYAVGGLAIGAQLGSDGSYREYKCSPSDQFSGFTWCQKTRNGKDRRGSYTSAYSLLHSRERNIVYVNRAQEPAFFDPKEVESEIQRYSSQIGEEPRVMKMPHRGIRDGIIAVWGKITLEPLDSESFRMLAAGKSPKKGLLIDFLGNFVQSAKEGLAIYRINGGPGFLWAASFDQNGRGTLRLAAVDASAFSSVASQQQSAPESLDAGQERQSTMQSADAPPEQQQTLQSSHDTTERQPERTEVISTVEQLQAELATAARTITELEKAKANADVARVEANNARIDAETALKQTKADHAKLDVTISRPAAGGLADNSRIRRWEIALYGSIGGLLVVLTASGIGFLVKGRASDQKREIWMSEPTPVEISRNIQSSDLEIISPSLSPSNVISERAFEIELYAQVAAINAANNESSKGCDPEAGVFL
jgi:hypothetical protein